MKKNAKTREESHKIFVGSLARVWGHLRQEVRHTAGRTDPVKKNAKTREVSHKIFVGSLARVWGHFCRTARSAPRLARRQNGSRAKRTLKCLRCRMKHVWALSLEFGGHLRQEVPKTAGRSQHGQITDFCTARAPNRQGVKKHGGPCAPPARRTGKVLENTRGRFSAARAHKSVKKVTFILLELTSEV